MMLAAGRQQRTDRPRLDLKEYNGVLVLYKETFLGDINTQLIYKRVKEGTTDTMENIDRSVSKCLVFARYYLCTYQVNNRTSPLFLKNFVEIPLDFIPRDQKVVDDSGWSGRLTLWPAFDQRVGRDHGAHVPGLDIDDVKLRILNAKNVVKTMSEPGIEAYYAHEYNKRYPNMKLDGRQVTSIRDFVKVYQGMEDEKERREMAFWTTYTVWKGNLWALDLEQEIMDLFGWKYSGAFCDGKVKQKRHPGGTIKSIIVDKKQTMLERLTNVSKKVFKEMYYGRERPKEPTKAGTNPPTPKPLPKGNKYVPSVVKIIHATVPEHGFSGELGLCEGHGLLISAPAVVSPSNFKELMFSKMKCGSLTREDLMALLNEADKLTGDGGMINSDEDPGNDMGGETGDGLEVLWNMPILPVSLEGCAN